MNIERQFRLSNFDPATNKRARWSCKNFKDVKAPGLDNLPMSTIKKSFDFICEPLLHIINLFDFGYFSI